MDYNYCDKQIKPRWLGVDIRGNTICACPRCNQVIMNNTESCPSCGQKFTYEEEKKK